MRQLDKSSGPASEAAAARLEEIIERFEDAWQRGGRPALGDYLNPDDPDRAALLVELVHVDLEYRLKGGEPARVEEYLTRYPDLGGNRRVVLELLAAEWKLRRRGDPSLGPDEYTSRFPDLRDDLLASATVSLIVPPPSAPLASSDVTELAGDGAAPPPTAASAPTGEVATHSHYRILRLHARGGLGEILTARDEELHREVALRRLHRRLAHAADSRGRFLREAEITSQLEHPGVVPVYGLGRAADGSPVYAMRFIRGETFQEAVERFHQADPSPLPLSPKGRGVGVGGAERRLAFRQLLTRFVSVCNTIAYAHSRGVLHRDIKPSNILLGSYGETLVVDWGLAKPAAPEAGPAAASEAPTLASSADLTHAGEVFGTPAYMSPEQADGRWDVVGPASDVYSLGATLYVLLTGRPPFGPGSVNDVLEHVRRGAFPRPRQVKKDACPALEAVCLKAMGARPEQRYATALALAADLEQWLAGEPVGARREPTTVRVRRWMGRHVTLVTTAAVALAACAVVAVVTALWLAAADREKSAKAVVEVRQKELDRADLERYYFHVTAANREWWADHYAAMTQQLKECRPALRGWEWNHLDRCARDSESLLTQKGHTKEVWCVAFTPDGKTLASASLDGTVRVWDAYAEKRLFVLTDHKGPVWGVAFSPDGATLATCGDDATVRLWDAKTGKSLRVFEGLPAEVRAVTFSPDGKVLAAAVVGWVGLGGDVNRAGGEVRLWDMPAGTERKPLRLTRGSPYSVAFSPDGKIVAAGTSDGKIRRWNVADADEQDALLGEQSAVRAIAFSADGLWIGAACQDMPDNLGYLDIWDARTDELKHRIQAHMALVWGVAFSPDSRRVATSADDHLIRVWDVAQGGLLFTLHGHAQGIANVVFSPDGARLASASDDQTVKVWDARGVRASLALCGHKHPVWGVAISPDGRRTASAGGDAPNGHAPADDAAVRVWDADGRETAALHVPGGAYCVTFGPGGRLLAAGGGDGTIHVWDADDGWKERVFKGHEGKVLAAVFSPDGRFLASASTDKTVKIWDVVKGEAIHTLEGHGDAVRSVAFSPDGKRLASGGDDQTIKLWDAATGEEQATLTGRPAAVSCVAFSPDGKRLAAASAASEKVLTRDSGEVAVWDLETNQAVLTMRGHIGDVKAVTYSPDGKRLVSAGWDGHLKFWEPTTGQEILTVYAAHLDTINALAFSPDGGRLASASSDATVIVWDGTPLDDGASK